MGDLELFIAVAEHESFTAAAAAMGITATAASRRVQALERRLGVRLLNRTTRRVNLTEAARLYYEQVRRIVADLRETEQQLDELANEPRGQLRITAPMSFGLKRLAPLLPTFSKARPQLGLQLLLDDRLVDIVEQGLDMALRIGYPSDSSMVARPILPLARYLCASPGYLAAHGSPREPRDLARHNCLHYSNLNTREQWTLSGPEGPQMVPVQGRYCSNNGDILCEAAVQGLGIALLPDFIVEKALDTGRLCRVLEAHEPAPFTLFALYPSRHYVPAKVRFFLEFITRAASQGFVPA